MRPKNRAPGRNRWFRCIRCGQPVAEEAPGTAHRNHCPMCLWSKHVDTVPGDRSADCGGAMEPVAVWARKGSDWAIIHKCRRCGELGSNRIAGDDNELALVALAVNAISRPPFPLAKLVPVSLPVDEDWPPLPPAPQPGRQSGT